MAWEKPSAQLIERFDSWLPFDPRVERRRMFGCPCAFVNGNMFAGVYQQGVVVRLAESARERLLGEGRAEAFSVSGRTMREYIILTDALARNQTDTMALIGEAFVFASALPAKKKSPSKRKR